LDRATEVAVVALANVIRGIKPADLAAEILCKAIASQPTQPPREWQPVSCPPEIRPLLGS
jgi:hypothetical protein